VPEFAIADTAAAVLSLLLRDAKVDISRVSFEP
jgi:hypothetical protein